MSEIREKLIEAVGEFTPSPDAALDAMLDALEANAAVWLKEGLGYMPTKTRALRIIDPLREDSDRRMSKL